jgi:two-component system cell cycle sensor histidine kinase/response regulator CckA
VLLTGKKKDWFHKLRYLVRGEGEYILIKPLFLFIFSIFALVHSNLLFPDNVPLIIAIASSFLIWFFLYVVWRTYKYMIRNKALILRKELYANMIMEDALAFVLVDNNAKVLDYTLSANTNSDIKQLANTAYSLNAFLQLFGIKLEPSKIKETFLSDSATIYNTLSGIIDLQKVELEVASMPVGDANEHRVPCFGIKISRIQQKDNNTHKLQDLHIGSYTTDNSGIITQCNDYFANMLGFTQDELISAKIKLSNMITNYGAIDREVNHDFIGKWQGFVTLKNKVGENVYLALIQKPMHIPGQAEKNGMGLAIRLGNDNMIMQAKGIESGWLDYSWGCFFDQSPYPVVIVDLTGKISRYNQSASRMINGLRVGKKFTNIVMETFADTVQEEMAKLKQKNDYITPPICNAILKGDKQIVDIHVGKINDLSGNIWGFLMRISDVSQKKELEDNLSHAQRVQTIGYLSSSIAHDFNNILTAIIGFSDVLLESHEEDDKSYNSLYQIRQSALRASNLVQKLLAFSRKQTLKPRIIDVNEILVDMFPVIKRLVGADVEIGQDISSNLWHVKVDPVQLEQVLLNLVVNAHHAMDDKKGAISIRASNISVKDKNYLSHYIMPHGEKRAQPGEYIKLEIADTGHGIKPSELQKIFEPFYTTKMDSGTGLGLSTVYGIVKQSGGYIYVNSVCGQGTSFIILLERFEGDIENTNIDVDVFSHSGSPTSDDNKVKSNKNLKKKNIVLLEDEDAVRSFVSQVLVKNGYIVHDYASPGDVLAAIKEDGLAVDLIISDVVMPGMSGPELVRNLPKSYAEVDVIFISGYGEDIFSEEYGENRDFHFLAKPFSMKKLLAMVDEVLR